MKVVGIVPARMASSRFPGKPMFPILGRPMIEHVMCRAQMFKGFDALFLATCDKEIQTFGVSKDWHVIMTSDKHIRCLDRVAEAGDRCGVKLAEDDIVACVQGDEPMLHPEMIEATVRPLKMDPAVVCTVLAMHIIDEEQWRNPDSVKLVHDIKGDVLYTSRAPIPYAKSFSPSLNALRIHGIFAFRWHFLKTYTKLPESPLEILESCDSNRIIDHGYKQRVAPYPFKKSFSVDSPGDIKLVEDFMTQDPLWGKY